MNLYEHITKMEHILDSQQEMLNKLDELITWMDTHQQDYKELTEYYYSAQREQDLQDEKEGKVPRDLKRGVLDEDSIYDMMGDYRETALHMMETAVKMLRNY